VVVIATQLLMQLPCFLAILLHLWLVASECKIGESSVVVIATQLIMQLPCFLAILLDLWLVAFESKIDENSLVIIATQLLMQLPCFWAIQQTLSLAHAIFECANASLFQFDHQNGVPVRSF